MFFFLIKNCRKPFDNKEIAEIVQNPRLLCPPLSTTINPTPNNCLGEIKRIFEEDVPKILQEQNRLFRNGAELKGKQYSAAALAALYRRTTILY